MRSTLLLGLGAAALAGLFLATRSTATPAMKIAAAAPGSPQSVPVDKVGDVVYAAPEAFLGALGGLSVDTRAGILGVRIRITSVDANGWLQGVITGYQVRGIGPDGLTPIQRTVTLLPPAPTGVFAPIQIRTRST